jgi:hypothetical protein
MAGAKNRFGLTFPTRLTEIVYRRKWPIGIDRLVPLPVTMSRAPPPSVPSRGKDKNGAGS